MKKMKKERGRRGTRLRLDEVRLLSRWTLREHTGVNSRLCVQCLLVQSSPRALWTRNSNVSWSWAGSTHQRSLIYVVYCVSWLTSSDPYHLFFFFLLLVLASGSSSVCKSFRALLLSPTGVVVFVFVVRFFFFSFFLVLTFLTVRRQLEKGGGKFSYSVKRVALL